jgi:sulfotransferase
MTDNRKTFYFMAGLPRSGSTVLSGILNQNPQIYSSPSSPVLSTMYAIENHLKNDELFSGYPKPVQAGQIISSVPHQFYSDIPKPVIIDKNRAWPARVPFIEGYIEQKAKIICTVRDIDEILTSMITIIRHNPFKEGQARVNFIDEQLIKMNIPINDVNRCEFIAGPNGILGQSINAVMEGVRQGFADRIHFVEYRDLTSKPVETLSALYEFLGEEPFEHTFDNIENQNRENDQLTYGLEDMHEVRKKLSVTSPPPQEVLPEQILVKCKGMDFWRQFS